MKERSKVGYFAPGLLALIFVAPSAYNQVLTPLVISREDKAEIIKQALEFNLSYLGAETFKEYLALSTENIEPSMVPEINEYHFTLVRDKDMRKKAPKAKGGLKWMRIAGFDIKGQRVEVVLVPTFMGPGKPPLVRAPSHHYIFEKVAGKWVGKSIIIICKGTSERGGNADVDQPCAS